MKIMVCVKRVIDANVRVRLKPDGSGVVTDGVKMSMNPFDEIAVEEALRIRERDGADDIAVVSIGPKVVQEQLRTALAMGCDRAIHVETDEAVQPFHAARILLQLVETEQPDLVLMGKQAIDDDNNQTAQMLSTLWGRPQATFCSKLEFRDGAVQATREIDAGLEVIDVDLPAVISTDLRLNEPRYVKLPEMMKAKRKPMDVRPLAELGVEQPPVIEHQGMRPPPGREAGIKVDSVEALVTELRARGLIS